LIRFGQKQNIAKKKPSISYGYVQYYCPQETKHAICVKLVIGLKILGFIYVKLNWTGQIAQVVRRSLLVREVWDSNSEPRGDRHRSLVTPERVLSEYNEDLIFFLN